MRSPINTNCAYSAATYTLCTAKTHRTSQHRIITLSRTHNVDSGPYYPAGYIELRKFRKRWHSLTTEWQKCRTASTTTLTRHRYDINFPLTRNFQMNSGVVQTGSCIHRMHLPRCDMQTATADISTRRWSSSGTQLNILAVNLMYVVCEIIKAACAPQNCLRQTCNQQPDTARWVLQPHSLLILNEMEPLYAQSSVNQ